MSDSDIWRLILSKLDNDTLQILYLLEFEGQLVRQFASDNLFWKMRAEHVARQDLAIEHVRDWKRVYYALLCASQQPQTDPHVYGFDYLPSLLALIQVYGDPAWTEAGSERAWKHVSDPKVLSYLISREWLVTGPQDENILAGLHGAVTNKRGWMIDPMLALASPSRLDLLVGSSISVAIFHDDITLVRLLIAKVSSFSSDDPVLIHAARHASEELMILMLDLASPRSWEDLVHAAMQSDNAASLSVIMTRADPTPIQALFKRAMDYYDAYRVVRMLDELDPSSKGKMTYRSLLTWTIKPRIKYLSKPGPGERKLSLVRYLLTKVSPATPTNQALKTAVRDGDISLIELLLSDERVDPTANLLEIAKERDNNASLDAVLRHPRTLVERLDSDVVTYVTADIWIPDVRDRMAGSAFVLSKVRYASDLEARAGMSEVRPQEGSKLLLSDLYSILLKYLIIKRPTSAELLDWMTAKRGRKFVQASVLALPDAVIPRSGVATDVIAFRSLLLYMLYPGIDLETHLSWLDGYSSEAVSMSAQLIGAYAGLTRLE